MKKLSILRAALLAATLAAPALISMTATGHAYNRSFEVTNHGGDSIWSVQAVNIDAEGDPGNLRVDLLGDRTIPSGESAVMEPTWQDDYCRFNLRIKYTSGKVVRLRNVNLCRVYAIGSNENGAWVD